jgi:hypothetical protein
MTCRSGEYSHHSAFGANFLMSHRGTASATSQKSGCSRPANAPRQK